MRKALDLQLALVKRADPPRYQLLKPLWLGQDAPIVSKADALDLRAVEPYNRRA